MPSDRAIRLVSTDIAKALFQRIDPTILEKFHIIERQAFPRTLDDVTLGKSIYAEVLGAISRTLRTKGMERAPTIEDVAMNIVEDVFTRLSELELKEELAPDRIAEELGRAFAEHPSLLDRASVAARQPLEIATEQLQRLEEELEQRVLKVVDTEGAISTAFALCEQGHILTASHVALDESNRPRSLKLALRYGDVRARRETEGKEATVIYSDPSTDIAVLQLADQDWYEFRRLGLMGGAGRQRRIKLALRNEDQLRGREVLCFGYQPPTRDGHRFLDPSPVRAMVAHHKPVRNIEFVDEYGNVIGEQACLVLIIAEGEERIGQGMSGGPIIDLETGEIIGMTSGAQRAGYIQQPYKNRKEVLPIAEYGFGVLLSDVARSWPGFNRRCLAQQAS